MLQTNHYKVWPYLRLFWRTQDFSSVFKAKEYKQSSTNDSISSVLATGVVLEVIIGIGLIIATYTNKLVGGWGFGLAVIIAAPIVWAHLICIPVKVGVYNKKENK